MNVNVPLEKIPVFVRQNSIYVTGVVLQGNSKLWNISKNQPTLSVFAYPGGEGSRTTFDYVDALDANTEKQITLADSGKTIEFTTPPLSTDAALWMRLDLKPSGLTVNGERASIRWEESKSMVEIPLTKGAAQKISITR
jgi:alpha-glucosidase (family GH31 glycosyl hydrolase)